MFIIVQPPPKLVDGGSSLLGTRPLAIAFLGMCHGCFRDLKHSHTRGALSRIRRLPRSKRWPGTARTESGEGQPRICCNRPCSRIFCSRAPPGVYGSLLVFGLHRNTKTVGFMEHAGILQLIGVNMHDELAPACECYAIKIQSSALREQCNNDWGTIDIYWS